MRILICSLFLFGSSHFTFAQNQEKAKSEILDVLTDFFGVFTHPNMKYFDKNCSSDFQLLENGEVRTRREIQTYVDKMNSKPLTFERSNSFEFIQTNIRGNFAWVNYKNTAKIRFLSDDSIKMKYWLESIILEKSGGKWAIHQMHSTPINNLLFLFSFTI